MFEATVVKASPLNAKVLEKLPLFVTSIPHCVQ